MDSAATDKIHIERVQRDGGTVAFVTMNFHGDLNILGKAEMNAFVEGLTPLAKDADLRAVVLRGAGKRAFIGGANIKEMVQLDKPGARAFITRLHEMNEVIRSMPVPVIAEIRGYCLGGGMEVAAACDIRIAAHDVIVGMPEVRVGIPSVIEAALLPQLIGWGKTRELLYTGGMYSAHEAQQWGFIDQLVHGAKLESEVNYCLDGILASGPIAIRAQKALIRKWESLSPDDAIQAGIDAFEQSYATGEPRAMMVKFLNRDRGK